MSNKLDVNMKGTQFEYCQTFFILFYSRCTQISKFIFLIYDKTERTSPDFFLLVISILNNYLCNSLLNNATISDSFLNNNGHFYIIINNFSMNTKPLQV